MNGMNNGIKYEQRDIVLVPFPYTDLTGNKQRPALIISNVKLNRTEDRICCLITSQPTNNGILINSLSSGNLPQKSWVKPYRLFTINERIIRKKICTISEKLNRKVVEEMKSYIE